MSGLFVRLATLLFIIFALFTVALAESPATGIDDPAGPQDDGAPVITSSPIKNGFVGELYTYDVDATGTAPLMYNLAEFPAGMQINPNTGLIQWSPSEPGVFNVTIQVLNSYGSYVQRYSLTILPSPEPPQIYTDPITTTLTGETYSYDVNATGYPLPIYLLLEAPIGMTINAASGQISWDPPGPGGYPVAIRVENSLGRDDQLFILQVYIYPEIVSTPDTTATVNNLYQYDVEALGNPAPNYYLWSAPDGMTIDPNTGLIEWLPDSSDTFVITVLAASLAGEAFQEYNLHVEPVYQAPSITSSPVLDATVGEIYNYDIDAGGEPEPYYLLVDAPLGMTIDSATGLIEWTPDTDGDYDIIAQAVNLAGSMNQPFTITVVPAAEQPLIVSIPQLEGTTGILYTYDVDATGYPPPDYLLINYPFGMTIDEVSGLIEWLPSTSGDFEVTIQAVNTHGSHFQNFTIHTETPQSPQIVSIPITSVGAGQIYSYVVQANGYPSPIYTIDIGPADMEIDSLSGQLLWNPLTPGDFNVTVRATNNVGTFTQSFQLSVVEAYQAPSWSTSPISDAERDVPYSYQAHATGYPIPTYHLIQSPAGMTIDSTTGLIEWTPDSYGSWPVELQAKNSVGTAVQEFTVSTSCCGAYTSGYTGNVDCDTEGKRNLADITRLIDHVYISKLDLCCATDGNVEGDPEGKVNLADITRLIDHVYISKNETASCN